jgi:AraC-like DNA-binding protein
MLRQPRQVSSFNFSTADLPADERRNAVCELRERGIIPIEPLPDSAISVQITKCFFPGAGILSGTLCGVRQEGTPRAVGASDEVFFGVNLAGQSTAFQRGDEVAIGDGDATLLSCTADAFSLVRATPVQFVGLRVPCKALAPLVSDLNDRMMRRIPRDTASLQLLTGYLHAIGNVRSETSPGISHLVVTHLHDLIALSVGATREAIVIADRSVRAARLHAIKSNIAANLADGSLTVAAIAARHGVSSRYLHKLFESEGTTFTQFILRERLDRAYRMLRDPRFVARSITSIAYDAGFGDLSYFNRTFRRHYGATPSDIRSGITR